MYTDLGVGLDVDVGRLQAGGRVPLTVSLSEAVSCSFHQSEHLPQGYGPWVLPQVGLDRLRGGLCVREVRQQGCGDRKPLALFGVRWVSRRKGTSKSFYTDMMIQFLENTVIFCKQNKI